MDKVIGKIIYVLKNETVLSVAAVLAIVSSFFVKPDMGYIGYIDMRTLALLFCLMAVMTGFQKTGVFKVMAQRLLKKIEGIKSLVFILVMLCFFFSMFITNDVALLTFIPFTFVILDMIDGDEKLLIRVVAMQTVAANLGSMLTPVGNPQNLYLQGISQMSVGSFVMLMLPYTAVSFMLLAIWAVLRTEKRDVSISFKKHINIDRKVLIYLILFLVCLLTVARVVDYRLTLVIVIAVIAVTDRRIFAGVDYTLLATFIAFFIFIGNMGRIEVFSDLLAKVIAGRECVTGILASQLISNVPAALLLSGFTDDLEPLIIGVDLGGLGTIIASMASLISFKFLGHKNRSLRGRYLLYFTVVNLVFLIVLFGVYLIFKQYI